MKAREIRGLFAMHDFVRVRIASTSQTRIVTMLETIDKIYIIAETGNNVLITKYLKEVSGWDFFNYSSRDWYEVKLHAFNDNDYVGLVLIEGSGDDSNGQGKINDRPFPDNGINAGCFRKLVSETGICRLHK